MKKFVLALLLSLSVLFCLGETAAHAETIYFYMYLQNEDYSESTARAEKEDWDPAVANVLGGLGGGFKANLRVRTAAGEPASSLIVASYNGRHTLYYLPGYGTVGRLYKLNASKHGWFNVTLRGRFAP